MENLKYKIIVLMGGQGAGKSAADFILGVRQVFGLREGLLQFVQRGDLAVIVFL